MLALGILGISQKCYPAYYVALLNSYFRRVAKPYMAWYWSLYVYTAPFGYKKVIKVSICRMRNAHPITAHFTTTVYV